MNEENQPEFQLSFEAEDEYTLLHIIATFAAVMGAAKADDFKQLKKINAETMFGRDEELLEAQKEVIKDVSQYLEENVEALAKHYPHVFLDGSVH